MRFIFLLEFLNFEFSPPPISNSSRGCVVADSEHLLCTHCRRTLSEIWNQNRSMYCRMLRHNHVLLCAIHTNMSPLGDNNTPSVSRETLTCAVPAAFRRIGWLRVQADVRGWRWRRHGVLIKSNKLTTVYTIPSYRIVFSIGSYFISTFIVMLRRSNRSFVLHQ